jgi:hypothetical protein
LGKVVNFEKPTPGYDHATGFAGFVRWIVAYDNGKIFLNPHFALQSKNCGFSDGVKYHVLRIEETGRWYRQVICRSGLQNVVKRMTSTEQGCFVATRDCGCKVHCGGSTCSESRVGTYPETVHSSFHNATKLVDEYYTADLARLVNAWADPDLKGFGYKPWLPGQDIELKQEVPLNAQG